MPKILSLLLVLLVVCSSAGAQDAYTLFPRTRALTTDDEGRMRQLDVLLLLSDEGRLIVKHRTTQQVYIQITPDAVRTMSFERSVNPADWAEGTVHWLYIGYEQVGVSEEVVLRLDKSEYQDVVRTIEERMGLTVELVLGRPGEVIPTTGSTDVDQVVDYPIDRVARAVQLAMAEYDCEVDQDAGVVLELGVAECKRAGFDRSFSPTGPGGEKVKARFEELSDGGRTQVHINTDRGSMFFGKNRAKQNWSTPIFKEMIRLLDSDNGGVAQASTTSLRAIGAGDILEEPREDSDVVATVVPGEILELLDDRGSWYLVRLPDDGTVHEWRTGWVSRALVTPMGR